MPLPSAFKEFRRIRDDAKRSGKPSFKYRSKTYIRKKSKKGGLIVYKRSK